MSYSWPVIVGVDKSIRPHLRATPFAQRRTKDIHKEGKAKEFKAPRKQGETEWEETE